MPNQNTRCPNRHGISPKTLMNTRNLFIKRTSFAIGKTILPRRLHFYESIIKSLLLARNTQTLQRARQADSSHSPRELMVFIKLKEKNCQVTPALLGYERIKQEPGDIIPGGYSICIVWDKIPGESLTPEYFWSLSRAARDTIRHEFRRVYESVMPTSLIPVTGFLPCGIRPRIATLSNLIYDEVSGSIHISGFCRATYVNPNTEWTDDFYVAYRLAKPPQPIPGSRDRTEWEL
ncbi:uncharacterized protein N7506_011890 [Penicillium brevicompactum]|uniref:uncharacterized protein n=1 Tax=Penicillium brevicompactum TaxID=5074 RepID=UPI00253FB13C|nr:uncharacterized protein N7506_011890 [Penicillium brevicompactum]KAJ5319186.1 hypothetical protein N7506_011890 [Penicillium brevicompactum]